MSRNAITLAVCAGALALGAPARADEPKPPTVATLTVNVKSFRNRSGALGCRLYRSSTGFPESSAGTVERRVSISGETTTCTFEGVGAGTYAVSVMHDENGNQKLDKNMFGVPTEGYGVSNNHTHALSNPTWEESKFNVESGKNLTLWVNLRY